MAVHSLTTQREITDPVELLHLFFITFPDYQEEKSCRITKAWNYLCEKTSGVFRSCGEPYHLHPFRVACILAESNFDVDSIIAGFFHNLLSVDGINPLEIEELFGTQVLCIISGTAKITGLK